MALDIELNEALLQEGLARELVSQIQTLRKESGFEVTDRVRLLIQRNGQPRFEAAVRNHAPWILAETLALTPEDQLLVMELPSGSEGVHEVALDATVRCALSLVRSAS